jgi:uncharacterized protein (TIGR00255 family)
MTESHQQLPLKASAPARGVMSMTGYGSAQAALSGWLASVEIRSVNSRFLDLTLKVPEELRATEPALREMLQAALSRGKVECRVVLRQNDAAPGAELNLAAVDAFYQHYRHLKQRLPELAAPSVREVLEWPGVRGGADTGTDTLREPVIDLARQALAQLVTGRSREGAALAGVLRERAEQMLQISAQLRERLPQVLQEQQTKITERLQAALGLVPDRNNMVLSADEVRARIAQEVVLIGTRIDVAEELDRLMVHCKEVAALLASGQPAGKRLDFVIQELNREANTLGSKMVAEDFSKAAVDLKVLIEQMREQVQNLE